VLLGHSSEQITAR